MSLLLRIPIKIIQIVLKAIIALFIVLAFVPFFITMAKYLASGTSFGDFFSGFAEVLGQYSFGSLATSQRTVAASLMLVGLIGGIIFSILNLFTRKVRWFLLVCGLVSIVGAFVMFPTLSKEAIDGYFGGNTTLDNYIVLGSLTYSLVIALLGLNFFLSGLSSCLKGQ